jgi:disease resistance protein RPM1
MLDNNQETILQSNVRWLANHNRTKGLIHQGNHIEMPKLRSFIDPRLNHQGNHIEMPKLRSFIALGSATETWGPLSSLTLLRVLALENCRATCDSCVRVEHLGRLLHLRFLSLRGTKVGRILEGIGALRFLQTLDLLGSTFQKCLRVAACQKG